jgi:hypothetical protein
MNGKTEKRHECTNIGKLGTTQIMMVAERHVASGVGVAEVSGRPICVGQCTNFD